MHVALPTLALLLLAALAPSASAQDTVTIYRCTDAAGNLTVQNGTPCPAGSTHSLSGAPLAPGRSRRKVPVPPAR